jgi:hypothetical protein
MKPTGYLENRGHSATLTTWVYCAMWQMYAAEKLGYDSYVNWPAVPTYALDPYWDDAQFARQPNMYDWYFKQHFGGGQVPPRDRTFSWESMPELNTHNLYGQPIDEIKSFYREHFHYSDAVEARGQALVQKYGLDLSKTIGLTWRGTDAITDGRPRLPIELYYPFIDDILSREPGLRILATAEEHSVLDPLLARYPQAFTINEFFASPLGCRDNPERFSPFSGFERGMQPALMVWIFSKCAHYIKNRSSTGFIASWMSTGNVVCLAHTENGAWSSVPPPIVFPDGKTIRFSEITFNRIGLEKPAEIIP